MQLRSSEHLGCGWWKTITTVSLNGSLVHAHDPSSKVGSISLLEKRRALVAALWLLGCGGSETPINGGASPSPSPSPSPAVGGGAAPSPATPPTGSPAPTAAKSGWTSQWAVPVPELEACEEVDADGDGFIAAQSCPGGDVEKLDCDDTDSAVTPASERWVRPGPFLMGHAGSSAGADEGPVHVVTLSGYCLDRTEASVAAVRAHPPTGWSSTAADELAALVSVDAAWNTVLR